ncbi:MAG: DUF5318 domain-containing protein [Actinobacteria bacterium]|nr:DUF5318 domain-containing protein [Actinomycetota bacterium]
MAGSGRSFDPTKTPVAPSGPVVDYSLARRAVIASVRRGLLSTTDVCDAHPELLRAAKNIGEPSLNPCPMCSHEALRNVRYVYGEHLGRDNGRVVYPADWLSELVARHEQFTCYIVEICIDCMWNHLLRSYVAGHKYRTSRAPQERREQG